jgi:LysM repeat protein
VALMLVALFALAVAKTAPLGGGSAGSTPTPTPSAAASALVAASPTASPTPIPSVEATPSVGPSASAGPTPKPSPSASQRTYKVRSGDTLTVIAAKFHTTVKAIEAANGIADPRTIHPGQTLVIP